MNVLVDTSVWSLALRRTSPSGESVAILEALVEEGRAVLMGAIRQELLSGLRRNGLDPKRNFDVGQLFPLFNLDPKKAQAEMDSLPGFVGQAALGAIAALISLPFQPVYAVFQYLTDRVLGIRVRAMLVPSPSVKVRNAGIDKKTLELIQRLQTG